jgi:membrane protein DedA with SNARE-associated domain
VLVPTLLLVSVAMFGDAIAPVLPGEVVMASVVIRLDRLVTVAAAVIVAAAATVVGQFVVFGVARRVAVESDHGLVGRWMARRTDFLRARPRWPAMALVIGGLVPGGRLASASAFGVSGGTTRRFLLLAATGGVIGAVYMTAVARAGSTILGDAWWAPLPIAGGITVLGSAVVAIGTRVRASRVATTGSRHRRRNALPGRARLDQVGRRPATGHLAGGGQVLDQRFQVTDEGSHAVGPEAAGGLGGQLVGVTLDVGPGATPRLGVLAVPGDEATDT